MSASSSDANQTRSGDANQTRSRRRLQVATGFADQVASSVSNIIVLLAIARVSPVDVFGTTTILFAIVTTAIAILRGCIGTPLSLTSGSPPAQIRTEGRYSCTAAIAAVVPVAVALLAVGYLSGSFAVAIALSAATPFVLVQDALRYVAMAQGAPAKALLSDTIWVVGSGLALLLTWLAPEAATAPVLAWVWTAAACISAVTIALATGVFPGLAGIRRWSRTSLAHRARFAGEAAIAAAGPLIVAVGATMIVGADATAALRGSSTLLGPLSVLISALSLAVVPDVVRRRLPSRASWTHFSRFAALMSVAAITLSTALYFLPTGVGEMLLGSSWTVVRPVLPITGLEYAFFAWTSCYFAWLKSSNSSSQLLQSRTVYSTSLTVASLIGGLLWGSALAMASGQAVVAIILGLLFARRASRCDLVVRK